MIILECDGGNEDCVLIWRSIIPFSARCHMKVTYHFARTEDITIISLFKRRSLLSKPEHQRDTCTLIWERSKAQAAVPLLQRGHVLASRCLQFQLGSPPEPTLLPSGGAQCRPATARGRCEGPSAR